ncbi:MAG: hypothetical protein CM15mP74_00910 [Halieaceae bacterium]|nr:MAG: hypothetical protein CM15mP74_00910 [Halieaceae bacterium]
MLRRLTPGLPQVITEVTEQVMRVVAEANTYFDEDPEPVLPRD